MRVGLVRLEDQRHFEVNARGRGHGGAELTIACMRCSWLWDSADVDEWPTLADLELRADEHLEIAHGGGS